MMSKKENEKEKHKGERFGWERNGDENSIEKRRENFRVKGNLFDHSRLFSGCYFTKTTAAPGKSSA